MILDLEGEFFFGAAPEFDRYFDALRERKGLRIVVLRVKRTRNPDIVCMERLQHFITEMAGLRRARALVRRAARFCPGDAEPSL